MEENIGKEIVRYKVAILWMINMKKGMSSSRAKREAIMKVLGIKKLSDEQYERIVKILYKEEI